MLDVSSNKWELKWVNAMKLFCKFIIFFSFFFLGGFRKMMSEFEIMNYELSILIVLWCRLLLLESDIIFVKIMNGAFGGLSLMEEGNLGRCVCIRMCKMPWWKRKLMGATSLHWIIERLMLDKIGLCDWFYRGSCNWMNNWTIQYFIYLLMYLQFFFFFTNIFTVKSTYILY